MIPCRGGATTVSAYAALFTTLFRRPTRFTPSPGIGLKGHASRRPREEALGDQRAHDSFGVRVRQPRPPGDSTRRQRLWGEQDGQDDALLASREAEAAEEGHQVVRRPR